ncbi:U3 small nucleolar RNA-associated protein 4, putative (UTP4) [Plasmodium ovale curtisi]|uniref:U3 small nucleolar RNA-associated protein 4, putative (UTP4) n=1 Tax=Plasmodium ovale curtisi TaxID=864141 RepID=A0A1A8W241_PLAOA|nr:U3 small nucleolar RNA-associated protein 4, putative (UTP4) [Plasmodium ovale curtisi]
MNCMAYGGEGENWLRSNLGNIERRKREKMKVSLLDFNFYENEKRTLNTLDHSPCKCFISIADSTGMIYIYKVLPNDIIYVFTVDVRASKCTIKSVIWVSKKKKKKHIFLQNDLINYLLIISTLRGDIIIYDLESQNVIQNIATSGSITCCRLSNDLHHFGITNLNGYFYLYNIYRRKGRFIYNCFDVFYEGKEALRGRRNGDSDSKEGEEYEEEEEEDEEEEEEEEKEEEEEGEGEGKIEREEKEEEEEEEDGKGEDSPGKTKRNKKVKLSGDYYSSYVKYIIGGKEGKGNSETVTEDEAETNHVDTSSVFMEKKNIIGMDKDEEEEQFNIHIKRKFKCQEKLICLYFVDVLKKRTALLKKFGCTKKIEEKKKCLNGYSQNGKRSNYNDNEYRIDNYNYDSGNEHFTNHNHQKKEDKEEKKKIRMIEKSYNNYHHFVLLGSENSKIYKYNLEEKSCVGEYVSTNRNSVIWDIMYIYRTDEVVCVDNMGTLTVFDFSKYCIKYHFNNHNYKAISLAKSLNERTIFSAGIDRHIHMYTLTEESTDRQKRIQAGNHIDRFSKGKYRDIYFDNDRANCEGGFYGKEVKHSKDLFFYSEIKRVRKSNSKWCLITKNSAHMAEIKKIIFLLNKHILSISDDLTICLYNMLNYVKIYYSVQYLDNSKKIMFSPNMKAILCVYSKKLNIHYNNDLFIGKSNKAVSNGASSDGASSDGDTSDEAISDGATSDGATSDGEKVQPHIDLHISTSKYRNVANILYQKNEYIRRCCLNRKFNKIACLTNRKFCIYHFNIDTLKIFNYDVSSLNFFQVHDFAFVNNNEVIVSIARCSERKMGEANQSEETGKTSSRKRKHNVKEEKLSCGMSNDTTSRQDQPNHFLTNNVNENLHICKHMLSYYVVIYNIKKKKIVEELKVKQRMINFNVYNKGIITCSDDKKNVHIFFKNLNKFLKNYVILNDFNISTKNEYQICHSYFVVENYFIILTMDNFIFVYIIDFKYKRILFHRKMKFDEFHFNGFSQIVLLNLNVLTDKSNLQKYCTSMKKQRTLQNGNYIEKGDDYMELSQMNHLKYNYCLVLKRHNQMQLTSLNIFDDNIIEINTSTMQNKMNDDYGITDEYYFSSLQMKYNFLNVKQMYFQDNRMYTMIIREMKKSLKENGENKWDSNNNRNSTNEGDTFLKDQTNCEDNTEKNTINLNPLHLSFKTLVNIRKRNIINFHFLYTSENSITVLVCIPKDLKSTLINVPDTKKYIQ